MHRVVAPESGHLGPGRTASPWMIWNVRSQNIAGRLEIAAFLTKET